MVKDNPKPFLRWAGGKNWLVKQLPNILPPYFNNYHEPFLGGGSVFIYLKASGYIHKNAFLSDINVNLINAYKCVKSDPEGVFKHLTKHRNEKEYYYEIRNLSYSDAIERAAQFIFLNRTSFNGIYRENLKGVYNVPYGNKTYKELFNEGNLLKISSLFKNAHFSKCDFGKTLKKVKSGDLVFIDPPYTVAHENNGFIKYNQRLFSWDDQVRLMGILKQISKIGAYFIMTNAAHKSIHNLYKDVGKIKNMRRASVIGGIGANRDVYNEYLITNY